MVKSYRYIIRGFAIIINFFLLIQCSLLQSQSTVDRSYMEIREDAEKRYGPSSDLLNGEVYKYSYKTTRGNPFLWVPVGYDASVQIKGRVYENQRISYDIYNQLMVLDFVDRSGGPGSVVLRDEWVDHLILGGTLFKQFTDENGSERYGQVIFEGKASCVYFWEKRYLPDLHEGEKLYYFTDPIRQSLIVMNGYSAPYTGNRSFLKCFPKQQQQRIRVYLKENRIKVKKADDRDIQSLMESINQLFGDEN